MIFSFEVEQTKFDELKTIIVTGTTVKMTSYFFGGKIDSNLRKKERKTMKNEV